MRLAAICFGTSQDISEKFDRVASVDNITSFHLIYILPVIKLMVVSSIAIFTRDD